MFIFQQFPSLAPPISNRRNTSSGRIMQNRPLPSQPAQQQQPQSSLLDLMDVFTTPAAPATSASTNQPEAGAGSQIASSQISSAVTSIDGFETSNPTFASTNTRGNQQAQGASTAVTNTVNTGATPLPSVSERATPIAVAFIECVNARLKMADQTQYVLAQSFPFIDFI